MKRDPKSFWRMSVAFVFAVVLAGASQLIINLLLSGNPLWRLVLQLAAASGLVAYIIAAFHERGLLYSALVILATSILVTVLAKIVTPWILQILLVLGFAVLITGSMIAGDILGRPNLGLRLLISASLGTVVCTILAGILGLLIRLPGGFIEGITGYLPVIFELGIIPPLAIMLTRIILGEKRKEIKEQEQE